MENKEIQVQTGSIDKDVLDIMKDKDFLTALGSEIETKRVILNCFCEFLSEIKGLRNDINELTDLITVCSAEKVGDYFKELQKNVKNEQKRLELEEKIHQSHKKSKKSTKKLEKAVK